jgi:hypothetical protein
MEVEVKEIHLFTDRGAIVGGADIQLGDLSIFGLKILQKDRSKPPMIRLPQSQWFTSGGERRFSEILIASQGLMSAISEAVLLRYDEEVLRRGGDAG